MNADQITKGQTVRHDQHGLATVKRILRSGKITIELREGIRAGQWYDAAAARLQAVEGRA